MYVQTSQPTNQPQWPCARQGSLKSKVICLEDSIRSKANLPTDLFPLNPRGASFHVYSILDLCCKSQQKGMISFRYGTKSCNMLSGHWKLIKSSTSAHTEQQPWREWLSLAAKSALMPTCILVLKGFFHSCSLDSILWLSCPYKVYFLPFSCSFSFSLFSVLQFPFF